MERYVCLLATDDFVEGVLVLNYNLQQLRATRPLLCLVSDSVKMKTKRLLDYFHIEYRVVPALSYESNKTYTRWNHTFDKLHIFSLVGYDKIVYLDSDFLILKNLDHLFEIESFTMNSDIPYHTDSCNSSIVITKPNMETYNGLINSMRQCDSEGIDCIGDQDIMNRYFKNIHSLDSSYNLMRAISENKEGEKYLVDKITADVEDPKVFHYIGYRKPFMIDGLYIDQYSNLYEEYLTKVRKKEQEFERLYPSL